MKPPVSVIGRSGCWDELTGEVAERIGSGLDEVAEHLQQGGMTPSELGAVMGFLERTRARVDSLMCAAARAAAATESDRAEVLRDMTRLSTREAKRMARVAGHLSEMPKAAQSLAAGDITFEHAAALSNAAQKVGADVVEADSALLEEASRTSGDRFAGRIRGWSERKLIEAGVDPLERQRRGREAKMWVEQETGLGVLLAKFPRPQFEHIRQAVDSRYLQLLHQDGAKGEDPDKVRTPQHRLADVIFELLTGRDARDCEPLPSGSSGGRPKASTQLVITAPLGAVDGTDPDGRVEIIGVGHVPRDILKTLTPDTELAAMIFDRAGRPLWLGRNQRLANVPQRLAVAVRDGGCFVCGAPMHRCELHHIRQWRRDRGPTDVDNLVAVCRRHHRRLETGALNVRHTSNGQDPIIPRDGPAT